MCDLALGTDTGLLRPAAGGLLRDRRAQDPLGSDPHRWRVPALPARSTPSGRWRAPSPRSPMRGRRSRAGRCPSRGSPGSRSACCVRRPEVGDGQAGLESDLAEDYRRAAAPPRRARRRGAHPAARGELVAALQPRGSRVAPRPVPRARRRVRRQRPGEARARTARRGRRRRGARDGRSSAGGATSPTSTCTSRPASRSTSRPRTATSSTCASGSRRSCAGST